MICSKCGHECSDNAKFCTQCGSLLTEGAKEDNAVEKAEEAEVGISEATAENETPVDVTADSDIKDEASVESKEEEVAESSTTAEEKKVPQTDTSAEASTEVSAAADSTEIKEVSPEELKKEEAEKENTEKENTEKEEAKSNGKPDFSKLLKFAIPVVAVLILIIILANALKKKDYITLAKDAIITTMNTEEGVVSILNSGKVIKTDIMSSSSIKSSLDRSVSVFISDDDEMIVFNGKKYISTGIDEVKNITISTYGSSIAYFRDIDNDTDTGTLFVYYVKNGKVKEIAEDVRVESAVLSPDGKTVAYVADFDAVDDFNGYYSIDGRKPVEIGKEKRVFAIANGAKYMYYVDDDRIYSAKKKGDGQKLASEISSYVSVYMNADNTEILVYHDDKMYVSEKAKEKKKASNDHFSNLILPENALSKTEECESLRDDDYGRTREVTVYYTGVDTFKEKLFQSNEGIIFLNGKFETSSVVRSVAEYALSKDGKTLAVCDFGGNILKITDFKKGGIKKSIASDTEATSMFVDGSFKYFYYINEDDELWMSKGSKPKKISDDVSEAAISEDGKTCYFIFDDEKLCSSTSGGKKKTIKTSEDGSCNRLGKNVFYAIDDDDEITLYLINGRKLKQILKTEE